jgi:RecJ-like exonuclease
MYGNGDFCKDGFNQADDIGGDYHHVKESPIPASHLCHECDGSGECPQCHNKGERCSACQSTGKCPGCHGVGMIIATI